MTVRKTLSACSLLLGASSLAFAAPINDNWADRIAIPNVASGTPYTTTEADATNATVETIDPTDACNADNTGNPTAGTNSLWYSYTTGAQTEYLNLSMPFRNVPRLRQIEMSLMGGAFSA